MNISVQINRDGKYWVVSATGPAVQEMYGRPRYRKKYLSEKEALTDKARLNASIQVDLGELMACLQMLRSSDRPGKGSSLTKATSWFLQHYSGGDKRTVETLFADYVQRKTPKLRPKSLTELKSHQRHFVAAFGTVPLSEITKDTLEHYLATSSSRPYRDKTLRGFFRWCMGEKVKRCTKLAVPAITSNPMDEVPEAEFEEAGTPDYLTVEEVTKLLKAAKVSLPYIAICLFTGARPEEIQKMCRMGFMHFVDRKRMALSVPGKTSKVKTSRELPIRPILLKWLDYFAAHKMPLHYSKRDIMPLWQSVFPGRDRQDIFRHTFISHAARDTRASDLAHWCGTSVDIILEHYLRLVTDEEAVKFFALEPARVCGAEEPIDPSLTPTDGAS